MRIPSFNNQDFMESKMCFFSWLMYLSFQRIPLIPNTKEIVRDLGVALYMRGFPLTNQTSWYKNASVIAKMVQPEEVPDEFSTWTSTITVWETTRYLRGRGFMQSTCRAQTRERWQVCSPCRSVVKQGEVIRARLPT